MIGRPTSGRVNDEPGSRLARPSHLVRPSPSTNSNITDNLLSTSRWSHFLRKRTSKQDLFRDSSSFLWKEFGKFGTVPSPREEIHQPIVDTVRSGRSASLSARAEWWTWQTESKALVKSSKMKHECGLWGHLLCWWEEAIPLPLKMLRWWSIDVE